MRMLDISDYQAGIGQSVLAQADVVVVKATEGKTWRSTTLAEQVKAARAAGAIVGVYHYMGARYSWQDEAEAFLTAIRGLGTVLPVLDLEGKAAGREADALAWMKHIEAETGIRPILYTGNHLIKAHGYKSLRGYPLWVANYPYTAARPWGAPWDEGTIKALYPGWDLMAWQYTETGRLDGWRGDLDLNECYWSRDRLLAHIGGKPAKVEAAAKPKPPAFPLPKGYYYGPRNGPARSVSGKVASKAVGKDISTVGGRAHSVGLARWQKAVGIGADGIYGPKTAAAAKKLQKAHGLKTDGLIGARTWAATTW